MSLNISIRNEQNYYYLQLDSQLQGIYQQVVSKLCKGELSITLNMPMPEDFDQSMDKIFTALDYGCPELFFLDKGARYTSDGSSIKITFTSKYSAGRLESMWHDLNEAVELVVEAVNFAYSDEDKIGELNNYICKNVKTNSSFAAQYGDAYGALINQEARCEGICKAVQLVLNRLNIKNLIAFGESDRDGSQENHAWSIIWVNGEPYGFDFTWNIDSSMFGVVCVDYMFLAKEDIDIEHVSNSDNSYPIVEFSQLAYWYQNNTEVTYRSDFSNVLLKDIGNNYYAIMRLMLKPTYDEVKEEVYDWYISEMGGDTMYGDFYYRYNSGLGILTVYVIVEEL